jgi:hypothetical protein
MSKHLRPSKRNYIDENRIRAKEEAQEAIPDLVTFGDENDFVAYVKVWNPEITPEKLRELVILYREVKLARARGK